MAPRPSSHGAEGGPCAICGSSRFHFQTISEHRLTIGGDFVYAVCSGCQLVSLANPPGDMDRFYSSTYSYHTSRRPRTGRLDRLYARLVGRLMKRMDRYQPTDPSLRVLDVGCATGQFLDQLRRRGFRNLVGIEASRTAVERKVSPELDIRCVPFADFQGDGCFDLITLNQVFEHLEDPRRALIHLRDLLSPRGRLVMSFPNYRSLARTLFGRYWPGYDAPRHYFVFSPGNIARLCEECGLTVMGVRYISRPSQFLGSFQYIWNQVTGWQQPLEAGFFRSSRLLDLAFMIPAHVLNWLQLGDMIEVHIARQETAAQAA